MTQNLPNIGTTEGGGLENSDGPRIQNMSLWLLLKTGSAQYVRPTYSMGRKSKLIT
ncbi:MAG: hypothetical protein GDA44_00920 [Prochloron sp. SP5CPC1]|nr:hypothetical protein [Candidatus Paraprochloron terpiosi SP5CPC1]